MGLLDNAVILDAKRLSRLAKATIQLTGRLGFSADAAKLMKLEDHVSLIVFALKGDDLCAVVAPKGDDRGFVVNKSGPYFYVRMKNYFDEKNVDYKKYHVIYDITESDEEYEGMRVFKMTRRDILRGSKEDAEEGSED